MKPKPPPFLNRSGVGECKDADSEKEAGAVVDSFVSRAKLEEGGGDPAEK